MICLGVTGVSGQVGYKTSFGIIISHTQGGAHTFFASLIPVIRAGKVFAGKKSSVAVLNNITEATPEAVGSVQARGNLIVGIGIHAQAGCGLYQSVCDLVLGVKHEEEAV